MKLSLLISAALSVASISQVVQGDMTAVYPGRCCALSKPDFKKTERLISSPTGDIYAIDAIDVITSCEGRGRQFAVSEKYPNNLFCATKSQTGDSYGMQPVCELTCAVETTASWFTPSSGSSFKLSESITWSTKNSTFRSDFDSSTLINTYSKSATAGLKLDFLGLSGSGSVKYDSSTSDSTSATVSKTFENTVGGTKSNEFTVDCPNGIVYQYRVTQKGITPEQGSVKLDTMHFICSPRDLIDVTPPVCPPEACFVKPGDPRDGCQCCTSDRWAAKPELGNKCQ